LGKFHHVDDGDALFIHKGPRGFLVRIANTDLNHSFRVDDAVNNAVAKRRAVMKPAPLHGRWRIVMGVEMDEAQGLLGSEGLNDRVRNGVISPYADGYNSRGGDPLIEGKNLLNDEIQLQRVLYRNVADVPNSGQFIGDHPGERINVPNETRL